MSTSSVDRFTILDEYFNQPNEFVEKLASFNITQRAQSPLKDIIPEHMTVCASSWLIEGLEHGIYEEMRAFESQLLETLRTIASNKVWSSSCQLLAAGINPLASGSIVLHSIVESMNPVFDFGGLSELKLVLEQLIPSDEGSEKERTELAFLSSSSEPCVLPNATCSTVRALFSQALSIWNTHATDNKFQLTHRMQRASDVARAALHSSAECQLFEDSPTIGTGSIQPVQAALVRGQRGKFNARARATFPWSLVAMEDFDADELVVVALVKYLLLAAHILHSLELQTGQTLEDLSLWRTLASQNAQGSSGVQAVKEKLPQFQWIAETMKAIIDPLVAAHFAQAIIARSLSPIHNYLPSTKTFLSTKKFKKHTLRKPNTGGMLAAHGFNRGKDGRPLLAFAICHQEVAWLEAMCFLNGHAVPKTPHVLQYPFFSTDTVLVAPDQMAAMAKMQRDMQVRRDVQEDVDADAPDAVHAENLKKYLQAEEKFAETFHANCIPLHAILLPIFALPNLISTRKRSKWVRTALQ
jgi:hypothetical protein